MKTRKNSNLIWVLIIALTLMVIPPAEMSYAQDPPKQQPDGNYLTYLPLVSRDPVVTFKAGSFMLPAASQAASADPSACSFEFAQPAVTAATTTTQTAAICPMPGIYAGLAIMVDGKQEKLMLGYQDSQPQMLVASQLDATVSNVETFVNPLLTIDAGLFITPSGGVTTTQRVKVVQMGGFTDPSDEALASEVSAGIPSGISLDLFFSASIERYIVQHGGYNIKLKVPSIVPFYSELFTSRLTMDCGTPVNDGEEWYPIKHSYFWNPALAIMGVSGIGGVFTGGPRLPGTGSMHQCMSLHTYLLTRQLRTAEWAEPLRVEVESKVGGWDAPPFAIFNPNWNGGAVYEATWFALESGMAVYILSQVAKTAGTRVTNVFFIVPENMLTCPMIAGQRHCVIANQQAAAAIVADLQAAQQ